ncbi:unnamed protein product [Phytomonas sp. Hart1]|nr:unnamed protein product [Phytomonas sp. Hart1]|eukprot:CCW71733.1 unnamed protein product [Phytomonas sp. isolate Hart1]
MIERARRHGYASRYWATPHEAAYLFQSPFPDSLVGATADGVGVANLFTSSPLYYYNVSGTADPSKFTAKTCQRYDPFNYIGRFYRPITAVQLKRFAIAYDCLDQQQWVTPLRVQWLRTTIKRDARPVIIFYGHGRVVQLVNINMTENPKRLEEFTLMESDLIGDEDRLLIF